ncbi:glycoside hydrolase family 2 protein [Martelella mediterranea]|uniref:glycoside hydrolase family 2 protein n=1 Tax=Martelella mediterranea TaxID=293089 RepID=UPI001E42B3DF|nr:glycoside hydrolase family 2 TIM barrel-domain containing protein [Martelella mediterranea]MCD1632314.1 glycoside hydrolase family 2 protein [Martelella mediterranea]
MRKVQNFNAGWVFSEGFDNAAISTLRDGESVRLPHTAVELPFNYFDEKRYQRAFTYQKVFANEPGFAGKRVSLVFDAAMADSVVFLNGKEIAAHKDGYTPFEVEIGPHLKDGDNLLTVKIDGSENPDIPPFGNVIDYLTFAGIYRDVWLKITTPVAIDNVKIETPDALADAKSVTADVFLTDETTGRLSATLSDAEGKMIAATEASVSGRQTRLALSDLKGLRLWDIDDPALYTLTVTLETEAGTDDFSNRFGFRTASFASDGFRLNGRLLKLRGLNRHQSWPHLGYAMGRRGQEKDADILKFELACNIARTSHYPQSKYFLDRCDEIGLLVFEEIPGWQHIGGDAWKRESVENVRRMITRDWNHPSIIIWGVRINESADDHDFYAETNRVARALDATRQTGGVRCIENSEMLEDVYTMNDFVLGDEEQPGRNHARICTRDQRQVTGLSKTVPYMITEYNGHMYPTKRFDQESRQAEHVTRHLQMLNAVAGDPTIAGSTGWCMFDYNTHSDFGSGDRICYHGVMDMYREPKFAAYAYASQGDPENGVVLQPVTFWARGERNIGGVLPLIILTNCDYIELTVGDSAPKRVEPARSTYPHLPHPPVILDSHNVSAEEFGDWGRQWFDGTLTGYIDGKPVRTMKLAGNPVPTTLEIAPDATELRAGEKDCVRVILRALDQCGNIMPFFDEPVALSLDGPGRIVGPEITSFRGGTAGLYIEAGDETGTLTLSVRCAAFADDTIAFTIS